MGHLQSEISYRNVMPEIIVRRDNSFLLVQGVENGAVFWWPPGAYWVNAGTCDLQTTQPHEWIDGILEKQVGITNVSISLKGVSIINKDHPPVLIYYVEVCGKPIPNEQLGFRDAQYFETKDFPTALGRDEAHGSWLKELVSN